MNKWLFLSAGGIVGTLARYTVATRVPEMAGTAFPYGTLAINLSACLLLGIFESLARSHGLLGPEGRILLMTGFCGAYSTFSTLILESAALATDGQAWLALLNYLGSGVAGFALFRIGVSLGGLF